METAEMDFENLQAVPSEPNGSVTPTLSSANDGICTEPGCNNRLQYSGRGRRPTKCAIHKRSNATRKTGTRTRKASAPDYRPGIMGLLQLPAGVLAIAGLNKPELAADAATITVYGPPIAEALNDLAYERPEIAAVLDRVLAVGPYGALIAAVAPMALQILCNHGAIPSGILGTVPKESLLAEMARREKAYEDALKAEMEEQMTNAGI